MKNVQTVQRIYEAFGRGDVPAILETLAEGVEWEYGAPTPGVPYLQHRRGRAAVAGFFSAVNEELEITSFQPKTFLEGPGMVAAIVDLQATARKTGRRIVEEDEAHLWHFDASGRIVRFRHRVDTYQHVEAMKSR